MKHIDILETEGSALRFRCEGEYTEDDIGDAVEGLIALLDKRFAPFDSDEPDFPEKGERRAGDGLPGDPGDHEPSGDAEAGAWVEWGTRGRHKQRLGPCEPIAGHEDDEDDDPAEDDDSDRCAAGDDHMIAGAVAQREFYSQSKYRDIGDDTDAEPNGDVEPNGDEGDYTPGAPWE